MAAGALCGAAQGVTIDGHLRETRQITRAVGDENVRVLLANFSQDKIVGVSTLRGRNFSLAVPDGFHPRTAPMNLCPGVRATPSEPRTYTAETLLVYHAGHNRAATLMQADSPTDPTRRTQWVYSDRPAHIRGRCTGLNTHYDLQIRQGWTAVMTVSKSGSFMITNATPGLPYWVQGPFMEDARKVFGGIFGKGF